MPVWELNLTWEFLPYFFRSEIGLIRERFLYNMHSSTSPHHKLTYECECDIEKKFRLTFDGGDNENYFVEYCQNCYDSDDKQFMISEAELF